MYSLLIVEDDKKLAESVKEYLSYTECYLETTVSGGLRVARNRDIDLIVLDLELSDGYGLDLIKALRIQLIEIPILVVSSASEIDTVVRALQLGADGYLTKPFSMRELKARIDALLARPPRTHKERLHIHDLVLDRNNCQVRRGRQTVFLRKREFEILEYLVRNEGCIITRDQLLNNIWDGYSEPYPSTVDVHVSNIRKQLKKTFGTELIKTAHGLGYQIVSRKL